MHLSQYPWHSTSQQAPVVVLNPECDDLDLISSNTHLMHSEVRINEPKCRIFHHHAHNIMGTVYVLDAESAKCSLAESSHSSR